MNRLLRTSLVAQMVKNLPAIQEIWFQFLGQDDPWRREWLPTLVFLPGEFHGQRSLADYIPWGCKNLDMTEVTLQACRLSIKCRPLNCNHPSTQPCPAFSIVPHLLLLLFQHLSQRHLFLLHKSTNSLFSNLKTDIFFSSSPFFLPPLQSSQYFCLSFSPFLPSFLPHSSLFYTHSHTHKHTHTHTHRKGKIYLFHTS